MALGIPELRPLVLKPKLPLKKTWSLLLHSSGDPRIWVFGVDGNHSTFSICRREGFSKLKNLLNFFSSKNPLCLLLDHHLATTIVVPTQLLMIRGVGLAILMEP